MGESQNRREFLGELSLVAGAASVAMNHHCVEASQQSRTSPDVEVLVFDTFGTVVDWRGPIITEGAELSKKKGLRVDWAAFADARGDRNTRPR